MLTIFNGIIRVPRTFAFKLSVLYTTQSKKEKKNHTPFSIPTSTKKILSSSPPPPSKKFCQIIRLLYYYLEKNEKKIFKKENEIDYNDGVIVLHILKRSAIKLARKSRNKGMKKLVSLRHIVSTNFYVDVPLHSV